MISVEKNESEMSFCFGHRPGDRLLYAYTERNRSSPVEPYFIFNSSLYFLLNDSKDYLNFVSHNRQSFCCSVPSGCYSRFGLVPE